MRTDEDGDPVRKGKQPQQKVRLPEGWWPRLNDLCRSLWQEPKEPGDRAKPRLDIYEFTGISRRTFSTARNSNEMTEPVFQRLTEKIGFERQDDLLERLKASVQPSAIARTNDFLGVANDEKNKGLGTEAQPAFALTSLHGQVRHDLDEHRTLLTEILSAVRGNGPPTTGQELAEISPLLRDRKALAKAASRKHDEATALRLWEEVRGQAELEGNKNEEILAQLEMAFVLLQTSHSPKDALRIADSCLQQAKGIELGNVRCHMLQLVSEMHRITGNIDLAHGFQTSALELARKRGSKLDEGMALLSMAATARPSELKRDNAKQVELVRSAYEAFSAAYLTGDSENQRGARRGFALCHCLRAEAFALDRPDEALAEWSRALEAYRSLGAEFEWDTADTLLHRSKLLARQGEAERAAIDLDGAAVIFQGLENQLSLARCFLQAGELLDLIGRRDDAAEQYEKAVAVATLGKDERRTSYFHFRHACKLLELRKLEEAETIFIYLMNAEWLDLERKLDVISQLCMISQSTEKLGELKERCSIALSVVDDLIADARSPEEQRDLLLQRSHFLSLAGRSGEALTSLKALAERFRVINDEAGAANAWFKIRGIMQDVGDSEGEREACDVILSIGEKGAGKFLISMTLVQLAQLNIQEQRFREALLQLDRAMAIDPGNPAVAMVTADLRTKLPKLSPITLDDQRTAAPAPQDDFPTLIKTLHEWCALYPQKRKSILAIWYSIYRSNLWSILRSMIGVKFLICTAHVEAFDSARANLAVSGDLFVWGTTFSLRTKPVHKPTDLERVRAPMNFLHPAGTTLIAGSDTGNAATPAMKATSSKLKGSTLLKPVKALPDKPYYLAYMTDTDGTVGSFYVGRKQVWDNQKVPKFMLDRDASALIEDNSICLPLGEFDTVPTLNRTMRIAWEHGVIPVFAERLPQDEGVGSDGDMTITLPAKAAASPIDVKGAWAQFLSTCAIEPRPSLARLARALEISSQTDSEQHTSARIYLLRFNVDGLEVVHPALVLLAA